MPFGEPVVLHSRTVTGQDVYGNDVYASTDSTVYAAFAPAGSNELIQGQDVVITQDTLYIRDASGVDPNAVDKVTARGVTYDVDGTPAVWVSPWSGDTKGIVVRLQGVTG